MANREILIPRHPVGDAGVLLAVLRQLHVVRLQRGRPGKVELHPMAVVAEAVLLLRLDHPAAQRV